MELMRRVNLTRFCHTSVDLEHEIGRHDRGHPGTMANKVGCLTHRATQITPGPLGELFATKDLCTRLATETRLWPIHS